MSWTYSSYVGANVGISLGLATVSVVSTIAFLPYKTKLFMIKRILGIELGRLHDPESPILYIYDLKVKKEKTGWIGIYYLFFSMVCLILSLMPIVVFDGCVLASVGVYSGDQCPNDPMDCYIFSSMTTASLPTSTFACVPGSTTNFPTNSNGNYAWCYGWIIRRQTTSKIINQLGICAGLVGLFGTLFSIIFHMSKHKRIFFFAGIFILCLVAAIVVLPVFKIALSLLTYYILVLCIVLCLVALLGSWHLTEKVETGSALQSTSPIPPLSKTNSAKSPGDLSTTAVLSTSGGPRLNTSRNRKNTASTPAASSTIVPVSE